MTKLLDILQCARPVLFANDDRDYSFSISGTAFIVRFRDRSFVVTAKHVLNLGNFRPEQFCIQYRPDGRDFVPLGALHLVRGADSDDTDQSDIAVREVDQATVNEQLYGNYHPYQLYTFDRFTIFSGKGAYLYRGYPIEMRVLDFERRHIEQGAVSTRAEYVGRTPYAHIHELHLLDLDPLTSIDGLSGSPVFQVHNDDDGKHSHEAFAGMLLRGSVESGTAYFIEHSRIIDVLMQIVEGRTTDLSHAIL
jgi:hypothetical protein